MRCCSLQPALAYLLISSPFLFTILELHNNDVLLKCGHQGVSRCEMLRGISIDRFEEL